MVMPGLPQPDFLRPVRRVSVLTWAWCATGLLVLAVAAVDAATAWQGLHEARVLHDQALRPSAAARAAPARTAPGPQAGAASPAAAQAAQWLQRLALPWPTVFAAAEAAAVEGVRFSGLSFDGRGQLLLEGQVGDAAAALAAADALRTAADVQGVAPAWRDVTLTRLDNQAEQRRFELLARLAAGAGR